MIGETYEKSVHSAAGWGGKIRATLRHGLLSTFGSFRHPVRGQRSLRFLMGHFVFDDQRDAFAREIDILKGLGDFLTTEEALSFVRGDRPLDGSYFHLSFDDGLDCLARNAAPILDAANIRALVFVNSAVAGEPEAAERAAWERATNYARPLRVMNWKTLSESNFDVGAHTRTHARLSEVSGDPQRLAMEVSGCKTEIEAALGRPCSYFAWPYGQRSDIDSVSLEAIRAAGYEAAFGAFRAPIEPGITDLFLIPRHQMEPHWPARHIRYFALGGGEARS